MTVLLIVGLLGFGWWLVTHRAAQSIVEVAVEDEVVPVVTAAPKHHHRKH